MKPSSKWRQRNNYNTYHKLDVGGAFLSLRTTPTSSLYDPHFIGEKAEGQGHTAEPVFSSRSESTGLIDNIFVTFYTAGGQPGRNFPEIEIKILCSEVNYKIDT